jgi:[ribosomal protein S5]-alanine N-acetyltransferase
LGKGQRKGKFMAKSQRLKLAQRLKLIPVSDEIKRDIINSKEAFSQKYEIILPDNWPKFPEAFEIDEKAQNNIAPFCGYLFIEAKTNRLIGNGGMVGPPDENGIVEIGYEIAPFYQGQGFATEAAQAMIEIALDAGAKSVIAHTEAFANASNAVLKKLGMKFAKELNAEEPIGKVWQWRLETQMA